MTELDSTPTGDVAAALVVQLEAEASFVDDGSFKLDPRKAREKLAAHQLAEPERYVLLLVEAAHLLPSCTDVAFTIEHRITRVVFTGVELRTVELQGCFDALFVDATGLDPDAARSIRGRQRLALALNAALGLSDVRVEVLSTIAGEGSVRVLFDADGRAQVHTRADTSTISTLTVEVHSELLSASRWRQQQDLLRQDARVATVSLRLNGVRIDAGPSADLVAAIEIRDAAGQAVGRAGWCAAQARRKSGQIAFVANGVVVESDSDPRLPVGLLARLDANDLQRDVSQFKLQRDDVYQQRVEAVVAACETLSKPVPTLGPPPDIAGEIAAAVSAFVSSTMFLLAAVGLWMWIGFWVIGGILFAVGLGFGIHGAGFIERIHRHRKIRRFGRPGLGVTTYASGGVLVSKVREMEVGMWIERPGQENYWVAIHTTFDKQHDHCVETGKRVYVRIDPIDHQQVMFDPG